MDNVKVRATSAPWFSGIEFLIRSGNSVVKNVEFVSVNPGEIVDPSFRISIENAQILMDDLWGSGIRPTDGTGSAGQLKATESHLKDMRTIVFNFMRIEK